VNTLYFPFEGLEKSKLEEAEFLKPIVENLQTTSKSNI